MNKKQDTIFLILIINVVAMAIFAAFELITLSAMIIIDLLQVGIAFGLKITPTSPKGDK